MPIQKLSPNFEAPVGVEANAYQYNGKELNEDHNLHWMDYGARWYNPQINQWGQIDPLAEKYASLSPYAYVANNPIMFIDPDGQKIVNAHEEFSVHVDLVNSLRNNLETAKQSGNKQEIKNARQAYRNAERNGLVAGVEAYNTVENLLSTFKERVGEQEYNYFDNLVFNGNVIDINIEIAPNKTDGMNGKTSIEYTTIESVDFISGDTKDIPEGILNHKIEVFLKQTNVGTLGNEMGDVKFGVERAEKNFSERNKPYWEQTSTRFSFHYEDYVKGKRTDMPNPQDY